jgi:UPF0755 protein
VLLVGIAAAAYVFMGPTLRDVAYRLASDNPQTLRLPLVGDLVRARLGDDLTSAVSGDDTIVPFTVEAGQSLEQIAANLAGAGLIRDPLAFAYYVITRDVDDEIQTGYFNLRATMTPGEIVDRLRQPPDPPTRLVLLNLRGGLRIEQAVALLGKLQVEQGLETDVQAFYRLAMEPPDSLRREFSFLEHLPRDHSLEGFMGSGSITVPSDISAEELIRVLLADWQEDVGAVFLPEARAARADVYQTMILASLVERETGEDREKARIAGVYLNRLDPDLNATRILNADPTVIYAVDTMKLAERPLDRWPNYAFWTPAEQSLSKIRVPAELQSYQTYKNPGLPEGPIATPTLASLRAALDPDRKGDLLYFFACPGEKTHLFAKTLAEQERNIDSCS